MTSDDRQLLADLAEAVRAAPHSEAVLRSLLRAARQSADNSAAVAFLATHAPDDGVSAAARALTADFLLESQESEAALRWAAGEDDSLRLAAVRALISLSRLSEATAIYRPLVARNAALRDATIDARLGAANAAVRGASVVDLRGRPVDTEVEAPVFAPLAVRERLTFADVGGLDDVKSQIARKIILPFQKPSLFQRFRKKSGGGVLMYGPPGCGKTMLARATAGECGAAFINVEIPDVLDMYIGESEKRLAAIFAEARQKAPSVLFFDEIEALAARRRFGESGTGAALVSAFLAQMDGFSSVNEGVLVLAATNVPWAIDQAFRRHGRFERFIFVPPPDLEGRCAILERLLTDRPQSADLDLAAVARRSPGFSGADLASLVEEACDLAIADSLEGALAPISAAHLEDALKTVKPTTIEWLTSARNYAKYANQGGLYDDVRAFLDRHAD